MFVASLSVHVLVWHDCAQIAMGSDYGSDLALTILHQKPSNACEHFTAIWIMQAKVSRSMSLPLLYDIRRINRMPYYFGKHRQVSRNNITRGIREISVWAPWAVVHYDKHRDFEIRMRQINRDALIFISWRNGDIDAYMLHQVQPNVNFCPGVGLFATI